MAASTTSTPTIINKYKMAVAYLALLLALGLVVNGSRVVGVLHGPFLLGLWLIISLSIIGESQIYECLGQSITK